MIYRKFIFKYLFFVTCRVELYFYVRLHFIEFVISDADLDLFLKKKL